MLRWIPLQEHTKMPPQTENTQGTAEIHNYLPVSHVLCLFSSLDNFRVIHQVELANTIPVRCDTDVEGSDHKSARKLPVISSLTIFHWPKFKAWSASIHSTQYTWCIHILVAISSIKIYYTFCYKRGETVYWEKKKKISLFWSLVRKKPFQFYHTKMVLENSKCIYNLSIHHF